ncbi:MAG: hypothetical protein MI808_13890 [Pseudomonadales bacterium]|nr:hypothetical protein [Pseudomonadales bacterium]
MTVGIVLIALHGDDSKSIVYAIILGIFICIWLITSIIFIYKIGRKSKYAEAFNSVHDALHTIRDIHRTLDRYLDNNSRKEFSKVEIRDMLRDALTAVSQAYTMVTGVKCRVCIRVLGCDADNGSKLEDYYLETFARDSVSATQKKHEDSKEEQEHRVTKNTVFKELAEKKRDYFYHGSVWDNDFFESTSCKQHDYNSVLVFPIRYSLKDIEIEEEKIEESPFGEQILVGFLAIDAKPKNAFLERYDVQLGSCVADSLFSLLIKYKSACALTADPNPEQR